MEHVKRLKAWGVLCDGKNIYIVYRAIRDNPDYSLPKWHCEEWESLEETAYREVLEETWVKGKILWEVETRQVYQQTNSVHNKSFCHQSLLMLHICSCLFEDSWIAVLCVL